MADIVISYNQNILESTLLTLEASNLKNLVHPGMKVSIKPNMVLAKHPSLGATTHSQVVEGLIRYLNDFGVKDIEIIESAWIGDDTKKVYRVCGYDVLSKKYNVPLYDLKDDHACSVDVGEYKLKICKKAIETDFLINVPVLKAHCQTLMTCNMKNLKGCITDSEKRRFHALGLHRPIAFLNKAIKTGFCLVDGICGDLNFEEGGNPVTRNLILAAENPVLMDSYCAELLGYHPEEIGYLKIAKELGLGEFFNDSASVMELNKDSKPQLYKKDIMGIAKRLSAHVTEDKACSACYSALICALHNYPTHKLNGKVSVGQGFKGKNGEIGCGNCTSGFSKFARGCPPTSMDILEFLKKM